MMLARFLLIMSSTVTLVLGVAFFITGIYAQASLDLKAKLAEKIDLSTVPQGESMKKDVLYAFQDTGIVLMVSWIFITIGFLILTFSVLGLWAAATGSTWSLVLYLSITALTVAAYLIGLILVATADSIFGKPMLHRLLESQNTKFVSVAELYNNSAGDGAMFSTLFNLVQQNLKCCGLRDVGDIRKSPRWQASSRALAGLLKLRAGQTPSLNDRVMRSKLDWSYWPPNPIIYYEVRPPPWLRNRMPPNVFFLPDGTKLPQDLPVGIRIPNRFNITSSIIQNSRAIEELFEDSLVLQTPITCCKLLENTTFTYDAQILVKNLVDHNCPFQAENNSSIHNQTCFAKVFEYMGAYSTTLVLFGIFLGFLMTCNVALGVQLLIW